MRTIMTRWPSVLAVICFGLNVDFVIMPALSQFGVDGWRLFWCASIAATAEVLYWYWYSGWLARYIKKAGPPRRIATHFKEEGLLRRVKRFANRAIKLGEAFRDWFVDHAIKQMEIDTPWKKGLMHGAFDIIKKGHNLMTYPMMIGLGFVPFGWSVAIVLRRVHYVPLAFPLYLFCNAIKAWGLGVAYLMMPLWAKLLLWVCLITMLIKQVIRFLPRENGGGKPAEEEQLELPTQHEEGSP